MRVTSREEDALVDAVRARDAVAIAEVYALHGAVLLSFARRLTGDPEAAADLVHDVFVALPSALAKFRGDGSLRSYLLSIAVKKSKKHVRSAARRRRALARLGDERREPARTPERELVERELAREISRALDALPWRLRAAVVLCDVEGRGPAEAARVLGVPEGTVRSRLFHARRQLRAALDRRGAS